MLLCTAFHLEGLRQKGGEEQEEYQWRHVYTPRRKGKGKEEQGNPSSCFSWSRKSCSR